VNKSILIIAVLSGVVFSSSGCDLLLKVVDREMAEEKRLVGDINKYNQKVKEIQETLKEIGYNPGSVDGKLGAKTREAIESFQKDYDLKISGYLDKKTWKEISLIRKTNIIYLNKFDVRQVQTALKNAGIDPGSIDGKMGAKTKEAIKEFQASHNLVRDGKVGSKTWRKLKKYLLTEWDQG
jgi:peptidoglycan hydrolase-like protein with peptidoglycan-binding domain